VRDDFDSVVADRCRAVSDVAVPADLWSRVQFKVLDRTPVQFSEEEVTMIDLETPHTDEHRKGPKWVLRAALLVAAAVAAIALVAIRKDDPVSPADQPSPTVTVPPTTIAPATKTVRFVVFNTNIPVTFTAPEDAVSTNSLVLSPTHWTVDDGWEAHKGVDIGIVGLQFAVISNIYADGCQWGLLAPPVGPTVDDLAEAWANLPQYSATAAVDVTVDAYAGKQVGFTVPDYNVDECKKGPDSPVFLLWQVSDNPGFYAVAPISIEQRILDVNGTRLVISAYYSSSSPPQDRAALDQALASIQIG
jgi:hypothetical protein